MGKREWRESSNGPDCLDVAIVMSAIESLHGCHVALIVTPATAGSAMSVDMAMSGLFDSLPDTELAAAVGAHTAWPNKKGTSFWGEAYALCWTLDEAISKAYKQRSLTEG